jgi:hypothetical protein
MTDSVIQDFSQAELLNLTIGKLLFGRCYMGWGTPRMSIKCSHISFLPRAGKVVDKNELASPLFRLFLGLVCGLHSIRARISAS